MECVRGAGREVTCFHFAHNHALCAHAWAHIDCVCNKCVFEIDVARRDRHDRLHVFCVAKVCFGFSCCAAAAQLPALALLVVIVTNTCYDSSVARGHCLARSMGGDLCTGIFGEVRMHARCAHVSNRAQKWYYIVFSLLFVRLRMYV